MSLRLTRQRSSLRAPTTLTTTAPANPYEPFVREVLERLADDLNAGMLDVRQEAGGARYIVYAPGHTGRNIVVPATHAALQKPAQLPRRSARGLLSKLTLRDARGKSIHVPKEAILRSYDRPLDAEEMKNACRGCQFPNCCHGWKLPRPDAVVVLRLRENSMGGNVYGWYVLIGNNTTELVRVPAQVSAMLYEMMRAEPQLEQSCLVQKYPDCALVSDPIDATDFHRLACKRFARFRKRAASAALSERKTAEQDSKKRWRAEDYDKNEYVHPDTADDDGYGGIADACGRTCVICLEDKLTAGKRCRHDSCGAHVCATCYSEARGLCPICDRSSINADYPCSCCGRLTRLRQYGFPCVACAANTLCKDCFGSFSECGPCGCEDSE